MNNTQFRRLVMDTPSAAKSNEDSTSQHSRAGMTPALGSRMRSSIPMTPRSVAGTSNNEFARQLAERNAELNPSNAKKFRSSAAPKGTKLASGFQDRTQLRVSGEEDDKATRVKALEDMVKLGQMDQTAFEALRDEIVGGDVDNVHLVKGLDYKLLERVRKGEDVLSGKSKAEQSEQADMAPAEAQVDVEDELERMEDKSLQPIVREVKEKKGVMAPPPPIAGKKRTRNDILKELKASRIAAAEQAKQDALGPKFMKVGEKKETSRIEKDNRGREILITVDANGKIKRKVKKTTVDEAVDRHGLLMPDKDAAPLGMDVVPVVPSPTKDDDDDIFEGIGTDYNPLGDISEDDSGSDDDQKDSKNNRQDQLREPALPAAAPEQKNTDMGPPPSRRKNWLGDSEESASTMNEPPRNPMTDPTILAALKKASTINQEPQNEEEAESIARRKRLLESHDRDADDMDLNFGSSRFGDQEDGEESRVKLSVWGKDEEEDDGKGGGKGKRKRGGKKKKGDANNAADVLKVMERQKAESR